MREHGWYDKEGVTILEGKWQDFIGTKMLEDIAFDAVYTDTFSEEYEGEVQNPLLPLVMHAYDGTPNLSGRVASIF
jgi:hypothetical protein